MVGTTRIVSTSRNKLTNFLQSTPIVVGFAIAGAATAARLGMRAFEEYQKRPKSPIMPRLSKYYKGGFDPKMNKREAALILGLRLVTFLALSLHVISSTM